jgi:hypothetical protein
MMKIQMKELDGQLILEVEGRLAGAFVPELEHSWQSVRASQPNRKISVGFRNAGMAIQDILEQIVESPECKH